MLEKNHSDTTDSTLALTLTGVILFALINLFPFITFRMGGQTKETTLIHPDTVLGELKRPSRSVLGKKRLPLKNTLNVILDELLPQSIFKTQQRKNITG